MKKHMFLYSKFKIFFISWLIASESYLYASNGGIYVMNKTTGSISRRFIEGHLRAYNCTKISEVKTSGYRANSELE